MRTSGERRAVGCRKYAVFGSPSNRGRCVRFPPNSFIRTAENRAIRQSSESSLIVVVSSTVALAQREGTRSSAGSKTSSVSMFRIVRIARTIVVQIDCDSTSHRVRFKIGRQLRGSGRFAHQSSPCNLTAMQEYARAVPDHIKAIRLSPKNANFYNNRHWLRATGPYEKYGNGKTRSSRPRSLAN
jgi:hypothetical protein